MPKDDLSIAIITGIYLSNFFVLMLLPGRPTWDEIQSKDKIKPPRFCALFFSICYVTAIPGLNISNIQH